MSSLWDASGFLSAYGNFFPMVPGPAALVTMPDVDTSERGTCTVYCASVQVDKNKDGNMDLSFNGADATSQASPMVWWVNNDSDHTEDTANDPGHDTKYMKDCDDWGIGSQRDLEDFARLWICGVPALTNGAYQVTLSWANVASGTPIINLFDSVDTNGGVGYLTDTNVAKAQVRNYPLFNSPGWKVDTISPSHSFTFPANYFTNAGNKYFLFEGAGTNGSGELVMTISQNGNTIAQIGVWLDLHDVKDFYERAVITNIMSGAISNWTSTVKTVLPATSSALGDDQDLIVLVHGINVSEEDWWIESDTVFKRLYWAGYHGKFATVKWPCLLGLQLIDFNSSELRAYKASTALTNYLGQLRNRNPGYRLNLLVHSQGNAVVSEAIKQGMPFDTYILTQGALPASAYDVNAPTDPDLTSREMPGNFTPEWQPMGYHGVYTNLPGRMVNFFNTNDFVLGMWTVNQYTLKPDGFPGAKDYYYDGTNGWHLREGAPALLVTDPQESRAMISRSRTWSIGVQPPALGQTNQGVIKSTVELNVQFGFGKTIDDHSAQWTRPIQTSRPYFQQVLRSCLIQPAP